MQLAHSVADEACRVGIVVERVCGGFESATDEDGERGRGWLTTASEGAGRGRRVSDEVSDVR